jgi:ABC-2 type transport system ATP-binding protein
VPQGHIFGFLGANGAGKTTTIKIALGLQVPDAGGIKLLGHDSQDIRARENVGYLPERPYFQSNLTADEFLDFHRGLFRTSRQGARMSNAELLTLVGLEGSGPHFLRGFSKGMLQRIGIAQSLVNDPGLLILDEPMSGLDPVGRKEMRSLILEMSKRGKTVFFSSHIISDIESLCVQIAFLEHGHLKYTGRVDELLKLGTQEFEVLFRPAAGMSLAEMPDPLKSAQVTGDSYRLVVKGSDRARHAIELCWARGGEVTGYGRVQKSLEDALFGKDKSV